jgi:RimJ/RimL family protein N-acetyltransferase
MNLFGKSYQERAMALISIAHPDFRDELLEKAKEMGLLGADRTLGESIHGVYPLKLEEKLEIDGEVIIIRPSKPVDERRIQEHFYNLSREDIVSRFFRMKTSFVRKEVEGMSQIDYIKTLTIVAIVGEFGFGKVIGIGEYYLDEATNMAEVAFSVSRDWQEKGLGKILLRKIARGARDNGISGLFAYTSPRNQAMIRLFKSLPYKVKTVVDEDLLLSCKFDEIEETGKISKSG